MPSRYLSPSSLFFRYIVVAPLLLLSGCAGLQQVPASSAEQPFYRSELADAEAKALYAFSQFRLLAGDNRWPEAVAALERAISFDPRADYLRLNLAKALLHLDEADRSIELLQSLLDKRPDQVETHELLGDLLSYRNQHAEAVRHYRKALELVPDNEMLQMRLAMALGRQQRSDEAIDVLTLLIEKHPEAKLARLSLARFYQENEQIDQAMATYRDLLAEYPAQQQAVLEYGSLLESRQLFAEAYELYRQAIAESPRSVAVREQLALLYLKQRRLPEALEQFQTIRQQLPDNPQILTRIGLIQLELEDWPKAEAVFHQLLTLDSDNEENRYYLGLALLSQGKNTAALEAMAPIGESSPVFTDAVLQSTFIYKRLGKDDEAITALRKLLEMDIQKAEIYYYLASFLGDRDLFEEAEAVISTGLKQFPHEVDLLYQLGVVYEKRVQRDKALEMMQKVLLLDADHPDALNFIAYHQAENDVELELALTRALKALSGKQSGYIIDTLGWIYYKLGRFEESREQLEKASVLQPDDPVILEHLGDLYQALTLWDDAADAYRKVLDIDPQAEGVAEKLQIILRKNP
ncbi:MAG TPA: tetratricopeptide repeat protein [Malonomonas sp.]